MIKPLPSPIKTCVCLLLLVALASCGSVVKKDITPSAQLNTQAREFPNLEYVIQAGDELELNFLYNTELNQKLPVRPDGRISLPLVKEVLAAGLTPKKLEELLTEKYMPELKKPDITVIVRSFSAQKVFVDGEVGRPGLVPLTGPTTVMLAISQAGGLKDTARRTQVIVMRRNGDGPSFTSVVDLTQVIDGTDKRQDIALMPYDIVYVPKSAVANVNLFVQQYISANIPFPLLYGLPYAVPAPTR
jgi:protein involved in polysaccharide export with SLBB domain